MTGVHSELQAMVREVFAPEGPLARATEAFRPRTGQTEMALAVAHTVEQGGSLVVEAGTGVGKTFAYLVPALLSGERVLLSTATKTLQDQLFARDVPRLLEALGLPLRMALLKGRSSYLCQHRLDIAVQEALLPDRHAVAMLAKVQEWARHTRTGDLADLVGLDERSTIIPLVTSSRDNCIGSNCSYWRECHVNTARRQAMAADVVVINHHLFFADLAVRESGMAELLPSVRVVIFDEAHQLNETGTQFMGQQVGTAQLLDLTRDVLAAGLHLARGLADWQSLSSRLELAARDWRLAIGKHPANTKLKWSHALPEGVDAAAWEAGVEQVSLALDAISEGLETVVEVAPDFVRLQERVSDVQSRLQNFAKPCALGSVRWVDVGAQARLFEAPLDIADVVQQRMLGASFTPETREGEAPSPSAALPRSWIFTSATLGHDAQLSWFTEPCGLQSAQVLRVDSPFDYAQQAFLYVPRDMVEPKNPLHSEQVAVLSQQVCRALGGRTLVLTTTLRALRAIADILQEDLTEPDDPEVLYQGQYPKRYLMERFRDAVNPGQRGCVLVASASFWEGFDVPGEALQAVVIDKLPFPPPNDPMVEARSAKIEALGRSAFSDYALPEAAVALKQGAGRLIRRESDQGGLIVCDKRLVASGYGKRLLASLPPMKRLDGREALAQALQALTKTCTRAS